MKKIFYTLIYTLIINASFGQVTPVKKGAEITFLNKTFDYDTIERYSNGTRSFTFYNTGDAPLVLRKVKSGCSCTVPSYTKDTIPPKGKGQISAKYNTKKYGKFNRSLTVYSNAANGAQKITIKGVIIDSKKKWGIEPKQKK
ncbi:MAG: DUF1573 domain-containing protein [Flavobacteriales bacterium]